jgi:hypothetical protein
MDQKLNFNLGDEKNPTVTVLTGSALEEKYPVIIGISGILSAPAQFLEKKKDLYKPINCHLIVDKVPGKLTFDINDKDEFGDQVNGSLKVSGVLQSFRINTDHLYNPSELEKFLRRVKIWFADKAECDEMLHSLRNFTAKVTTNVEKLNDNNGNTKNLYETAIANVTLKKTFKLNIPLYEGYEKKQFYVEVAVDVSSSNVKFFLLSDELYELIETEKERLLNEQIAIFDQWGCAVVHIS